MGLMGLGIFALVRGLNAYGNMRLLRDDLSFLQWLHVSKYPPSLSFIALELGIMAIILAGLFRLQLARHGRVRLNNPVLVFGQTAFFFYITHIVVLEVAARSLGLHKTEGLVVAVIACLLSLVVLYPLCRWYRGVKAARPESWLRYF